MEVAVTVGVLAIATTSGVSVAVGDAIGAVFSVSAAGCIIGVGVGVACC